MMGRQRLLAGMATLALMLWFSLACNLMMPRPAPTSTSTLTPSPIPGSTPTPEPVAATNPPRAALRYDGLYQSPQPSYTMYLRFYADGTVLTVSSSGSAGQVATWFGKNHDNISTGKYVIQNSTLTFSATSAAGVVDYSGTINGEDIKLDMTSHINGNKSTDDYHFVKISGPLP